MRTTVSVTLLLLALASFTFPAAARTPGELPAPLSSLDDAALDRDLASRLEALAQAPVPADADLVVLFERLAMELGMNGMTLHLDGAVVLRDGHAGGLEYRVPLPSGGEIGETAVWRRRADGTVARLGEPAREEDPVTGAPRLVVSDPDAGPGDVVGWSAVCKNDVFNSRVLHPTREHFVAESEIRMIVPPLAHYAMALLNGGPDDAVIAVGEEHGKAYDQAARFTELRPESDGPFATPRVLRPSVLIAGMGQYIDTMQRWFLMDTWTPLAGYVATLETALSDDSPVAARVAGQAVKDDDSDRIKLLKLQRVVSRQLATIPPADFATPSDSPDEALERKAATPRMKTAILLTMAASLDLDVDMVMARDTRLGPLDDAVPSLSQFTDTLVRLNGPTPLYLTGDDRYPAGTLPHHLRGAPAISAAEGAAEVVQKVMMKAAMSGADPDWGGAEPLQRFVLPGDPNAPRWTMSELLAWDADGGAEGRLECVGDSDLFLDYRARTAAAKLLKQALHRSYPALELAAVSAAAGKPRSSEEPLHVIVKGEVTGKSGVPDPDGDRWTLPAAVVFGSPTASAWQEGEAFHVDGERTLTRTWTHPLPDGWNDVARTAAPRVTNDVLDYRAEVGAAEGVLTVTRTVTLRAQHRAPGDAALVAGALERVHAFETAPLVVERR